MKCLACQKELVSKHANARHCGEKCRAAAYRKRQQFAARTVKQQTSEPGAGNAQAGLEAERERLRAARLAAASSNGLSARPRVPLEDQVLAQAPPHANGYRLVLGIDAQRQPIFVPAALEGWSLYPFAPPDDVRLEEGKTYRILWLDESQPLRPSDTDPTPTLHFFLGLPDAQLSPASWSARQATVNNAALRTVLEKVEQTEQRLRKKTKTLRQQNEQLSKQLTQLQEISQQNEQLREQFTELQRKALREKEERAERREQQKRAAANQKKTSSEAWSMVALAATLMTTAYVAKAKRTAPIRAWLSALVDQIVAALPEGKTIDERLIAAQQMMRNLVLRLTVAFEVLKKFAQHATQNQRASESGNEAQPEPAEPRTQATESADAAPPTPQPDFAASTQQTKPTSTKDADDKPQAPESSPTKRVLRPILEPGQAATLLTLVCKGLHLKPSELRVDSENEAPESLTCMLVRHLRTRRVKKGTDIPGFGLLWEAFQASTVLAEIGETLEMAAIDQSASEAQGVTPLMLAYVKDIMMLRAELRRILASIDQSRTLNQDVLDGLKNCILDSRHALLRSYPGPEDVLAQMLHDALLEIRKILKTSHTKLADKLGSQGAISLEPLPTSPSAEQLEACQAERDALVPMKWEAQFETASRSPANEAQRPAASPTPSTVPSNMADDSKGPLKSPVPASDRAKPVQEAADRGTENQDLIAEAS